MRRFILIDPCLADMGSHPYQYCLDLFEAAERGGFACEAVTHRDFRPGPGEWRSTHRLEPILSTLGHSKYTAFGELDRLSPHGRPRLRFAAPWAAAHAERRRRGRIEAFAGEIAAVVGRASPGDVVLVATASELDLAGLARAIRAVRPPRGIAWHVQFHYPLYRGFLDDFPRQERRLDRIRAVTGRAIADASPHPIHLHVTTDELASQHARLGVAGVGVLPYPVRPDAMAAARGRPPQGGERLRLAVLGDARAEKQSHLLADIVERVAADPLLSPRFGVAAQSNVGFPAGSRSAADRAVIRALERLASMPRERVELLGGPLKDEAYSRQLAAADAVLLAYDQDRYRCRCSGVTLEAIAAAAVPIVTGGGSMARSLAQPIAAHVAAVVASSRPLAGVRHGPSRVRAGRPLVLEFALPGDATAIHAAAAWTTRGDDALQVPGAVVTLEIEGLPRRRLSLQPDRSGLPARGLLPVTETPSDSAADRPARISIAPLPGAAAIDLASFAAEPLATGSLRPCSAAGIVVPPGDGLLDSILDALREFARFHDHYRRTAAAHAVTTGERHSGDALLRAILDAAAGDGGIS